jgi:hypothetical protein
MRCGRFAWVLCFEKEVEKKKREKSHKVVLVPLMYGVEGDTRRYLLRPTPKQGPPPRGEIDHIYSVVIIDELKLPVACVCMQACRPCMSATHRGDGFGGRVVVWNVS